MLLSIRHLLDRSRHPRSRADDLARLRARFAAQPTAREVGGARVADAQALRRLRRELAAALEGVEACRGCARGHPEPAGRFDGGHCCGGDTFRVFTPDEVAALKWGGTRVRDWEPPSGEQAGCAFRGPRGCSLAPEHRPTLCLRYICMELRSELRAEPRWRRIGALTREIEARWSSLFSDPAARSEPAVSSEPTELGSVASGPRGEAGD